MRIGITGSVGSGKTTVAKLFSRHHCNRMDADEIAHRILKKDRKMQKALIKNFGIGIVNQNKNIDRKKLGDIAFADNKRLKKLNSIMHPLIIKEIKNRARQIQKECGRNAKIIIDAPLLLETKAKKLVDKIVVVKCSKERILKRNTKFTRAQIERILKAQMPLKEKLKYADFVVDNSKGLRNLERQVKSIMQEIGKK